MRKFFYWVPTLTWMGIIFYFSSRYSVHVSDSFAIQFIIFKSLHLIEYATLYILTYRSLRNTTSLLDWQSRYHAFMIALFYGMSDEIHQVFVPTREGHIRDVIIDGMGITIAFIYIWKYLPQAPKRLKAWAKKLDIL